MKTNAIQLINDSISYSDACRKLGFPVNGSGMRKIKSIIKEFKINVEHFKQKKWYTIKYKKITKICPVCEKNFETQEGYPREKVTCTYGCANSYFRSGKQNGQYEHGHHSINPDTGRTFNGGYRYLCLCFWPHVCAIPGCGWDKCIEIHHIDENHNNDVKENLIPLCPNHHRLTVIKEYKDDIEKVIKTVAHEKWAKVK